MKRKYRIIKVTDGDPALWTNVYYQVQRKDIFGFFWWTLKFFDWDDLKWIINKYYSEDDAMGRIIVDSAATNKNKIVVKNISK